MSAVCPRVAVGGRHTDSCHRGRHLKISLSFVCLLCRNMHKYVVRAKTSLVVNSACGTIIGENGGTYT